MEKIMCTKIGVDCVPNDPVDIRCGGPAYLGFDFYVKKEETEAMFQFVIQALDEFGIPLACIYKDGEYEKLEKDVWTRRRIMGEIANDAEYLKSAAERGNSR